MPTDAGVAQSGSASDL